MGDTADRQTKKMFEKLYKKMEDVVASNMTDYKTDFHIHDKNVINARRPQEFVWIVKDTMTFIFLDPKDEDFPGKGEAKPFLFGMATREQQIDSIADGWNFFLDPMNKPVKKTFLVDTARETITETTVQKAREWHMEKVRAMKREWLMETRQASQNSPSGGKNERN